MPEDNTPIQELRDAADRGRQATAEAEAVKRENAFLKAGIDPDSPKAKYFVKGYDGELTKDAILAEAKEAGVLEERTPPPPAEEEQEEPTGRRQPTEEEQEMEGLATEVSSEAAPSGALPKEDPHEAAWNRFSDRRKTEPREDAAAEVIGSIFQGAIEGDERFLADKT